MRFWTDGLFFRNFPVNVVVAYTGPSYGSLKSPYRGRNDPGTFFKSFPKENINVSYGVSLMSTYYFSKAIIYFTHIMKD